MLSAVYLILLVVFMGVIFADSADAKKFVGSLNQGNAGNGLELAGAGWQSISRPFTTGLAKDSYVLHSVAVQVHTRSTSRRAIVGIYTNSNGAPGIKVHSLTGSITSTGVRHFTAPPGSTLYKNTTYWVVVKVGSGGGTFRLHQTGSTRADTNPSSGWSLGSQTRYVRTGVAFYDGGLKTGIFGKDRFYNRPHTGRPSISSAAPDGVIQVNHTLTANISDISDINGIIKDTLSYQWILVSDGDETDISGATGSTYTPIDNYVGSRLKVRVSFIDADAYRESAVSAVSDVVRSVEGNALAEGKPEIFGIFALGVVLTADTSGISDSNGVPVGSFVYQWVRVNGSGETNISGANERTYTVVDDDFGKKLKVVVSFVDLDGFSEGPLVSDATEGVLTPWGVWSSGDVIWIVSDGRDRVYAYNLSTNGYLPGYSFDLGSETNDPRGIWSDGVTVWVAEEGGGNFDVLHAYSMSDKSRDSSKDFIMPDTNNQAFSPKGIWSDGVTMWVAKSRSGHNRGYVHAYKMSDKSGDSGKDFGLLRGHKSPGGVWSDGGTMWVVDLGADLVRAYNLSSKSYDSSKDFSLTSENSDPTGISSDNETIWVADSVDDQVYGYSFDDLIDPVFNSPPVFSSSSSFSVNENNGRVGAVVASDFDSYDTVHGYRVSGGVDGGLFSITPGGVLSFRSVPNYERPDDDGGDNLYVVVVNATSGVGGRVLSASQTIMVTVVDVVEQNSPATGRPAIAGSVEVGQVLTADVSGISDGNGVSGSFSYQWVRVVGGSEVDIFGANSSTYRPVAGDAGKRLKVKVGFVDNDDFPEGPLVSDATVVVAAAPPVNSPAAGRPTIGGVFERGQVLTVGTSGISDGNGVSGSFSYQWVRVDGGVEVDILGATGGTYRLVVADVGKRLKVEVGFVDVDGFSEGPLVSDATVVVAAAVPVNFPAAGRPTIGGVFETGDVLTVGTSGISDGNGIPVGSFVYQWVRVDGGVEVDIFGANSSTYTLVTADVGKRLKVKVSFVDDDDFSEGPLVSDVTSLVTLSQDFGNLASAGNNDPRGIWSGGGIMYVVDSGDDRVYAYNVSTKVYISSQSFDLVSENDDPWGVWSDGVTMWVAEEGGSTDYVYAYKLSDKSRDSSKDFSMPDSSQAFSPKGIWSDGVTMWVVKSRSGHNRGYIHDYKMSDKSGDSAEKDFGLLRGHKSPGGVWSDGGTMWVVDSGADLVRAYNLSSKSYDSSKDFSLTSENSDPTGIWSDGNCLGGG